MQSFCNHGYISNRVECRLKMARRSFILVVYKLPPQPTRLRIQAWRRLQSVGAVYLQDGVAALPNRPDLDENSRYLASSIIEAGGIAILLRASGMGENDEAEIEAKFRVAADSRMEELLGNLDRIDDRLSELGSLDSLAKLDEALKRERLAYLKARRLNYFGSELEPEVDLRLKELTARVRSFGGTSK